MAPGYAVRVDRSSSLCLFVNFFFFAICYYFLIGESEFSEACFTGHRRREVEDFPVGFDCARARVSKLSAGKC